ncbi:hypothetical protein AGMMS50229_17800 [Campylobacterota bacterium]|nr:hypothetical protein AGMMS50229_17800 [Campylobacterota bacterium]
MIALEWGAAGITLYIFYRVVIKPFARKMMAIKTEEPPEEAQRITFEDDDLELPDNSHELRRRVEKSLEQSQGDLEEKLKRDVLIDRLRKMAEEKPKETSETIATVVNEKGYKHQ